MLKINYASDMSNKEKMDNLFNAIHYESNTMMIAVNNDAIAICDKKIENKSGKFTEIQIEAEKAKKADLEKSNRKLKEENGTRNPSLKLLKRLADGMGMTLKIEFVPKEIAKN